jgi:hypothetical protein
MHVIQNYLWVLYIALAAICNAVMDICKDKYSTSIFKHGNPYFWDGTVSWKSKYVNYDVKQGRNNTPVWFTDAWHLFKSLMIVFLAIGLQLASQYFTPIYSYLEAVVIFGLVWNLTFNLFYNKLLRK